MAGSASAACVVNTFWEWEPETQRESARCRAYSDSVLLTEAGMEEISASKEQDLVSETTWDCASSKESWDTESVISSCPESSAQYDTDDESDAVPRLAAQGWHCGLPQRTQLAARATTSRGSCADIRTTLILKRLPSGVTRASLCKTLDVAGFAGLYDFLYLPVNFKTWQFFRYCVVNFVTHEAARAALETLAAWLESEEAVEAAWCERGQGLAAHIEQYRNSPVMHPSVADEYKPVLLCNGFRVAFPHPMAPVVVPNTRKSR